jgi:hypothetical protein
MATRGDVIISYEAFSQCDKSANKGGLCKKRPSTVTHLFWFLSLYFKDTKERHEQCVSIAHAGYGSVPLHPLRKTVVPQCVFETQRTDNRF